MNTQTTFLISGPLHRFSVESIDYYLSTGVEVVYTTWTPKDENEKDMLALVYTKLPRDKVSVVDLPELDPNIDNYQNVYYQCLCWSQGLPLVNRAYTVKLRSSLGLNNITPLLMCMEANPDKIVSTNYWFRPDNMFKYHPSDVVFGCRTDEQLLALPSILGSLERRDYPKWIQWAEQKICLPFLSNRGIVPSNSSVNHMIMNFEIVSLEKLRHKLEVSRFDDHVSHTMKDFGKKFLALCFIGHPQGFEEAFSKSAEVIDTLRQIYYLDFFSSFWITLDTRPEEVRPISSICSWFKMDMFNLADEVSAMVFKLRSVLDGVSNHERTYHRIIVMNFNTILTKLPELSLGVHIENDVISGDLESVNAYVESLVAI